MPTDPDYELWLTQHALIDSQAVEVLEFRHDSWGSLWITGYGLPFSGVTEDCRRVHRGAGGLHGRADQSKARTRNRK